MSKTSESLNLLRQQLDQINHEMLQLLERRFGVLEQVIKEKMKDEIAPIDAKRVEKMLAETLVMCPEDLREYILPIFRECFEKGGSFVSHGLQKSK